MLSLDEYSAQIMQKIVFISMLLLIGLFSLQLNLRKSSTAYYNLNEESKEEMAQAVLYQDPIKLNENNYIIIDSTGTPYLLKKKRLISL